MRWTVRLDVTSPKGTADIRNGQTRGKFVGVVGLLGQELPEQVKLCSIQ